MKKILRILAAHVLVIAFCFSVLSSLPVYAASNTYKLSDLGLEVSIPSGYSIITRNTSASDPIFSQLGTSKSQIINQFKANNIYLNAISDTNNEEIVVTMVENNISNFSLLSDTALKTLASSLVKQYDSYGINVSDYEVYQHSQAKFIRINFTDDANTVHGLQYYTIYDGKAINFTMRSYEGDLSFSQWSNIKTVVDSVKFDKAAPTNAPGNDTDSFVHTDADTGVTFTVPKNWQQKEFTKDREFIDVKFVSTKDDACVIIYGSTDMWTKMPASDKIGYTRKDINNSVFTKSDIAEMFGTTAEKISVVTYNDTQYFKGEFTSSQEAYGLDFSVTMTELIYVENGWMYTFQFGGTSSHKLYSDFEALLNSVQYPTGSNVEGIGSSNNTSSSVNNSNNNSDDTSGVIAVVILTTIVIIIVITVIVYNKKTSQNTKQTYGTAIEETTVIEEPTTTCKNCGQALPIDSAFCHICGTRINEEETDS